MMNVVSIPHFQLTKSLFFHAGEEAIARQNYLMGPDSRFKDQVVHDHHPYVKVFLLPDGIFIDVIFSWFYYVYVPRMLPMTHYVAVCYQCVYTENLSRGVDRHSTAHVHRSSRSRGPIQSVFGGLVEHSV